MYIYICVCVCVCVYIFVSMILEKTCTPQRALKRNKCYIVVR